MSTDTQNAWTRPPEWLPDRQSVTARRHDEYALEGW
jgi:hypothetical protein